MVAVVYRSVSDPLPYNFCISAGHRNNSQRQNILIKESLKYTKFQRQLEIYQRKKCMCIPQSLMSYIQLMIYLGQKRSAN